MGYALVLSQLCNAADLRNLYLKTADATDELVYSFVCPVKRKLLIIAAECFRRLTKKIFQILVIQDRFDFAVALN